MLEIPKITAPENTLIGQSNKTRTTETNTHNYLVIMQTTIFGV